MTKKTRPSDYVCLPHRFWPEVDKDAWQTALKPGNALDGSGPAAHWRPATQDLNKRCYGRWLSFLLQSDELTPHSTPSTRVTKARISAYHTYMQRTLAPRTTATALNGLEMVMHAIAPDQDWRWLKLISNRVDILAQPSRNKRTLMEDSRHIAVAACNRMDTLIKDGNENRTHQIELRDCLILALMTARPLRLTNFTDLEIGRTFLSTAQGWKIRIDGSETKNHDPILFDVPCFLLRYIAHYITAVRAPFAAHAASNNEPRTNRLWLGYKGQPLSRLAIYQRVKQITQKLLGKSINPHLLRDCAATTLSGQSVTAALTAAPLLGHRSFQTTEKHYIRANQVEASRTINALIKTIGENT